MAEEYKHHSWDDFGPKKVSSRVKYPWHEWLNGSIWLLVRGEDFDMETEVFRRYILNYCAEKDIKVKTKKAENGKDLYIKVVYGTSKQGVRRSRHFRGLKRRIEQLEHYEKHPKPKEDS